ncbi:hypothetical protein BDW59DRAFT_156511 [Aspergillus cavernicola]|uniref:Uncharacterized protein n=1 Tax=Aspergillus cavernicola TaxID=176166 RepID=A0ABR4J3S3_9EURO
MSSTASLSALSRSHSPSSDREEGPSAEGSDASTLPLRLCEMEWFLTDWRPPPRRRNHSLHLPRPPPLPLPLVRLRAPAWPPTVSAPPVTATNPRGIAIAMPNVLMPRPPEARCHLVWPPLCADEEIVETAHRFRSSPALGNGTEFGGRIE